MKRSVLLAILALCSGLAGCGGSTDSTGNPGPGPATSGAVDGSMALGDGATHTELSGVAYYEDFFVEGVALSLVPWGGAHCTLGGGFSPDFDWLGLGGHDGERFVMVSLSGDNTGNVDVWQVMDDEKGKGYHGLGTLDAQLDGVQLPKKAGDTVSGHLRFTDPLQGYDADLAFSVEYCGNK